MKSANSLYAFLGLALSLWLATACSPFGWFAVSRSVDLAPTPIVSGIVAPTASSTFIGVLVSQTPAVTQTWAAIPTATLTPGSQGPRSGWKTFSSKLYHYAVSYPSDWTVTVENPKSTARVTNTERVTFKQPGYGARNQFTTIMIEANQGEGWSFASCDARIFVSGVSACRNSMPAGQNPAQEIVYFQKGDSSFVLQLAYEGKEYIDIFNHMLSLFKFN